MNRNESAVVAGFSPEYLKHHQDIRNKDSNKIRPGDIIVAVDNLDTSNPAKCPFDKVIQHLSSVATARSIPLGQSHAQHMAATACVWDDNPLNFSHRTSSIARYNDTICIKLARPVAAPVCVSMTAPTGVAVDGMGERRDSLARRFAYGPCGVERVPEHLDPKNIRMNYDL